MEKLNHERGMMLTVGKLIEYLSKCNPDASIVAFEENSGAFIEQLPNLPGRHIRTVAEDREKERSFLEYWYRDSPDKEKKIEDALFTYYRYVNDDDIVIRF